MFYRPHFEIVRNRILDENNFIQVILGPRQVGKTTLVHQITEKINIPFYFSSADAVPLTNHIWLQQQWETARLLMQKENATTILLIIDEIQKIHNWSEVVKKMWDADKKANLKIKVILLGSSRLLLQQGLTESLSGRFETIYMGHWSFSEMQQAFGWNAKQYVWFGGYPASVSLIEDEERWKAYITDSLIETTLTRDILLMSRLDKPALLRQLFELGSLYSGQILSFSKIMGQLQDAGNTTTLSHYLNLLDTAGLLGGLEKYSPNMIRKRSSSPKFQVYNNALVSSRHSENFSSIQINPSEWGRIVESAVGAHLINHAQEKKFQLYYWRERNEEVDYILERKGSIIALEVKTSYSKMPSGMNSFQKKFSPDKVFMVGSNGIPWEEFLKIDPLTLF